MNQPWVYMCPPSWTPLPPPSPSYPSGLFQCTSPEHPVSCIATGLVIYFTYDNIHVSMLFSQIIPPSPSPTEYKRLFFTSVSLLLSHIQPAQHFKLHLVREMGLPWWLSGKVCTCQCRRPGFHPWVRKTPWSWKWQPTPGCLPGESKDTGAWQATVHGLAKSRTWQHVHTQWGVGGGGWKGIHLLHLVQNQKSLFYVLFNPISPSENTSGYRILLRSCGSLWVLFRSTLLDKSYACDSSEISLSLLGFCWIGWQSTPLSFLGFLLLDSEDLWGTPIISFEVFYLTEDYSAALPEIFLRCTQKIW